MNTSSTLDAALRELDANADLDAASLDGMSAAQLRAILAGMIEQAREIRAGLLSQATHRRDPAPSG